MVASHFRRTVTSSYSGHAKVVGIESSAADLVDVHWVTNLQYRFVPHAPHFGEDVISPGGGLPGARWMLLRSTWILPTHTPLESNRVAPGARTSNSQFVKTAPVECSTDILISFCQLRISVGVAEHNESEHQPSNALMAECSAR